jgi:hypothetical protein
MAVLPSPVTPGRLGRAREVASDLLIATALLWTVPLLLGAVGALVKRLLEGT